MSINVGDEIELVKPNAYSGNSYIVQKKYFCRMQKQFLYDLQNNYVAMKATDLILKNRNIT